MTPYGGNSSPGLGSKITIREENDDITDPEQP